MWHYKVGAVLLFSVLFVLIGCPAEEDNGGQPLKLGIIGQTLPDGAINSAYDAKFKATGGTPLYLWEHSDGSLPAGLALSPDGSITGTPTQSGDFSFTVKVTDSGSPPQKATSQFVIHISQALEIVTPPLPSAAVSAPYTTELEATGGKPSYTWRTAAGHELPTGLSLNPDTGAITGTPTQVETKSFTIEVSDSSAPPITTKGYFSIQVVDKLAVATTALPDGVKDVNYTAQLKAVAGTMPYTWGISIGTLPYGLSLAPDTGIISGVPTIEGHSTFTVRVIDNVSATAEKELSIEILAEAPPLAITTGSLTHGVVDVPYTAKIEATGGIKPYVWSITIGSLPDALSLAPATGELSGTPTTGGTYQFTVQVADSRSETDTAQLSIEVFATAPPLEIITESLPDAGVGSPYTAKVEATGGIEPYNWSITGTLPPGLEFNSSKGEVTGTPTAAGDYQFTVTVTDSSSPPLTDSAELSITVESGGVQVKITTTSLSDGTVGSTYDAQLEATSGTTPYQWSFTGSLPPGLDLDPDTGKITGMPTVSGNFSFAVTVTDSYSPPTTDTANLSIHIADLTELTIITASLPDGVKDKSYATAINAAGGEKPYEWSLASGTIPPGLDLSGTGTITGTPTEIGAFTITVKVTDSATPQAEVTKEFTIEIVGILKITTLTLPPGRIEKLYTAQVETTGGKAPLAWSVTANFPVGLELNPNTGSITGTPTAEGRYIFTVEVKDNLTYPQKATRNYTVMITGELTIRTSSLPNCVAGQDYMQQLEAEGGSPPYSWSISPPGGLPLGLTFRSTGRIDGTSTASGAYEFTATVTDTESGTDTRDLSITMVRDWTLREPATKPPKRFAAAMAYDQQRQAVVLFGGGIDTDDPPDGLEDTFFPGTWQWDGKNWTKVATSGPPGRSRFDMVYDSSRKVIWAFGGYDGTYLLPDLWKWDGSSWTEITDVFPYPSARGYHAMAYDSTRDVVVVFGGYGKVGGSPGYLDQTWEWDGSKWTEKTTSPRPSARSYHTMVYDEAHSVTVLLGGWDGDNRLKDTWEWNGATWTKVATLGPKARRAHAMAYDSDRNVAVIYSGSMEGPDLRDTWEWNGIEWSEVTTETQPPPKCYHPMAYDRKRHILVFFGGLDGTGARQETWEY